MFNTAYYPLLINTTNNYKKKLFFLFFFMWRPRWIFLNASTAEISKLKDQGCISIRHFLAAPSLPALSSFTCYEHEQSFVVTFHIFRPMSLKFVFASASIYVSRCFPPHNTRTLCIISNNWNEAVWHVATGTAVHDSVSKHNIQRSVAWHVAMLMCLFFP